MLSLFAKGLTTGEIPLQVGRTPRADFADVYDAGVSKNTASTITDRVVEQMRSWWDRLLETVYAAIFPMPRFAFTVLAPVDATHVKIGDGSTTAKARCVVAPWSAIGRSMPLSAST